MADMYGEGNAPKGTENPMEFLAPLMKDAKATRSRIVAAFDTMLSETAKRGIGDSSRRAAFLVAGSDKADIFSAIRAGNSQLPAARVHPVGELFWFVDQAAAGGNVPPERCDTLRTKSRARATAPAAMPAQAELQNRCATGIMVWA